MDNECPRKWTSLLSNIINIRMNPQVNTLNSEEFADALELLQILKENPQPSSSSQPRTKRTCVGCNITCHTRDVIRPTSDMLPYFPYSTCLHCLAKRCNPDEETITQLRKEFSFLQSTPDYVQRIIAKYNEIMFNIYYHSRFPLKELHLYPTDTEIYTYNIVSFTIA